MSKFLSAALVCALALTGLGYVDAQTGPTGPQSGAPTAQPGPAAPAPAVNGISETDLLNYLRTLDPNVRSQKASNGKGMVYFVTLHRDGWDFQLELNLQENTLHVITVLGQPMANAPSIPAQALVPLMVENFNISPFQFSLWKRTDGKMELLFSGVMPRAGLTPAILGAQIDQFCATIQRTYPLWSAVINAGK
jgi:hypothetical protein